MTKKERVKEYFNKTYLPRVATPTQVAEALNFPHSGYVARDLKTLTEEGWLIRTAINGTVLYRKAEHD